MVKLGKAACSPCDTNAVDVRALLLIFTQLWNEEKSNKMTMNTNLEHVITTCTRHAHETPRGFRP